MFHLAKRSAVSGLFLAAVVAACGGKVLEDPIPSDPNAQGADGRQADPNSGNAGSGGTGGTTGSGSGGTGGSGGTATADAGVSPKPPPGNPIRCGSATCSAANEDCCLSFGGPGSGGSSASCAPKGKCPNVSLSCSDSSSCNNGDVCCASTNNNSFSATCEADCGGGGGPGPGGGSFQLCQTTSECDNGQQCLSIPGGANLKTCRRSGR